MMTLSTIGSYEGHNGEEFQAIQHSIIGRKKE